MWVCICECTPHPASTKILHFPRNKENGRAEAPGAQWSFLSFIFRPVSVMLLGSLRRGSPRRGSQQGFGDGEFAKWSKSNDCGRPPNSEPPKYIWPFCVQWEFSAFPGGTKGSPWNSYQYLSCLNMEALNQLFDFPLTIRDLCCFTAIRHPSETIAKEKWDQGRG